MLALQANDAVLSFRAQHVPLDRFKKNLHEMLKLIPNDIPVLMISPPPFEPTMRREDVYVVSVLFDS